MTPIEKAAEAYENSRDPMQSAITAFLDAVLEDPKAMERIAAKIIGGSHRDDAENAIAALKQEAAR